MKFKHLTYRTLNIEVFRQFLFLCFISGASVQMTYIVSNQKQNKKKRGKGKHYQSLIIFVKVRK